MERTDKILFNFLQCCGLLFFYLILFFNKIDYLLIVLFFYSLFLGFTIIKTRLKSILVSNFTVIFVFFLFLYGIFNCLIDVALIGTIKNEIYISTLIYASTIPCFLIGFILVTPKKIQGFYSSYISGKKLNTDYFYFVTIVLVFLLLYKSFDFYNKGILFRPSVLKSVNRLELFDDISQVSVVLGLLTSSIFLYYIFHYKLLSKKFKVIVLLLLIYYVSMQISVGNRRDFVPMIIGAFWVFSNSKGFVFTFKWFIFMVIGIFIFQILGTLRGIATVESQFDYVDIMVKTLSDNEFVYPFFTLSFAVTDYLNDNLNLYYGYTLLIYPILIFFPRAIYFDKPYSLASDFVLKYFGGGMGYAYTPVSEAFLNFGLIGPAMLYLVLGVLTTKIQYMRDQRYIYIFFTMIPDFCRGEISSFIYQYFFISFFVIILPKFLKA